MVGKLLRDGVQVQFWVVESLLGNLRDLTDNAAELRNCAVKAGKAMQQDALCGKIDGILVGACKALLPQGDQAVKAVVAPCERSDIESMEELLCTRSVEIDVHINDVRAFGKRDTLAAEGKQKGADVKRMCRPVDADASLSLRKQDHAVVGKTKRCSHGRLVRFADEAGDSQRASDEGRGREFADVFYFQGRTSVLNFIIESIACFLKKNKRFLTFLHKTIELFY